MQNKKKFAPKSESRVKKDSPKKKEFSRKKDSPIKKDSSDRKEPRFKKDSSDRKEPRFKKDSSDRKEPRFKKDSSDKKESRFKSDSTDRKETRFKKDSFDKKESRFKKMVPVKKEYAHTKDAPAKKEFSPRKEFGTKQNLVNTRELRAKKEYSPLKELFMWGRRPIESYFATLHTRENADASKHALHIIVDKEKKAPSQLKTIVDSAKSLGISILSHTSSEEDWPLSDSSNLNHQRVCLKIPQYPVSHLEEVVTLLNNQKENNETGCVGLVLDQIQDPRNFGAILRSAAFFGAKFVIYATDRQSDIGGLVLKTSAGGAFSLMLVPVVNINRALAQLKEAGAWIAGATLQEQSVEMKDLPQDRNWILVLGNEEKGLRSEVAKNCDYLLKIPGGMGGVDSLNVSVAAGICLHQLQGTSSK